MKAMIFALVLAAGAFLPAGASSAPPGAAPPPASSPAVHAPVVTRHDGVFNGRRVRYTATVEGIDVPDSKGNPGARIVSFAYVADGLADPAKRPVLFLFNGGPITASMWVHLGGFGPKRVAFPDDVKADPSTFRLIDNQDSPLDVADLVFFDPASTGFSRVLPGHKPEDYFSVTADGQQTAAFIRAWLTRHGRLGSPVYVLGESYGTNRAAEVAGQLSEGPHPILLDGTILYGQAVNIVEYAQRPGNIISYVASLPTLAAIAWYHQKIDRAGRSVEQVIAEAQAYAATEYLDALFQGNSLPEARRQSVARHLEALSGIPADYYLSNDLRITKEQYRTELLKDRGLLLGRADARYTAPVTTSGNAPDPSSILPESVERFFRSYLVDSLKVDWKDSYRASADVKGLEGWGWGATTPFSDWPYYKRITEMFNANPRYRVMVANGYYDTQTTLGAAHYLVTQAGWPKNRVELRYYDGGHMGYSVDSTARRFSNDIRAFIAEGR
jgi:carboxypeptidase C (cathepsin A)